MLTYREMTVTEAERIAFYHRLGCVPAADVNEALMEEDPNYIQLEFELKA